MKAHRQSLFAVPALKRPMLTRNGFIVGAGLLSLVSFLQPVQAQVVANVGAVERVVEKRTGTAGTFQSTKKGASLSQNDAVQTGKRSKADVLFRDRSLVRLGQLSNVEIESGAAEETRVRLSNGRIMFVKVPRTTGTSRVRTGTGVAEVKGSIVVVQQNRDGSTEWSAYIGSIEVVGVDAQGNPTNNRVVLPPGSWVKTFGAGLLTPISPAPPLTVNVDLISSPLDSPFAGSREQVLSRLEPGPLALDNALPTVNREGQSNIPINPFIPRGPLGNGQPPIGGPFPPPSGGLFPGASSTSSSLSPEGFTIISRAATQKLDGAGERTAANGNSSPSSMAAQINGHVVFAQAGAPSSPPDSGAAAQNLAASAGGAALSSSLDLGPANKHIAEVDRNLGRVTGFDYRAVGVLGSSDLSGGYGRLHGFTHRGRWSADLEINPQTFRFDNPAPPGQRIERTSVVVSNATLSYKAKFGDIIAGRQRFLGGPVRASFYGSMVRQGGREVMDAVRFAPRLGRSVGAEISYLYDAYPRELPYRISGRQDGVYGRLFTMQKFGNFGLNLLNYQDSPIADQTGLTMDFSLPVLRNKVDFYGEIGKDPFKRKLRTFGVTLPVLYEKTGFDLYIERARLSGVAAAPSPGNEWAVRVYRNINENIDLVAAYNTFKGGNSSFIVGVSVGGHLVTR